MRTCLTAILGVGLISAAYADQTVRLGDTASGVTLLSQNQNGLQLRIDIGSLDLRRVSTAEGEFVVLGVEGFTRSHNIGEPNLPMVNRILSIPVGCDLQVEVLESEIEEISLADLGLTMPIIPVQPSLSKSQNPEDVPFEYEREVYLRSGYYTIPLTETSIIGIMRALRLGMISVAPIEYNPLENTLRVYKRLVIRIQYLHADWSATTDMRKRYYSPFFEPVYNQIINYEPLPPELLDDLVRYPVKYVIVSDRMFETQLQPLIEWKIRKGFDVVTAYTDEIGYSNTEIKSYLQDLYYGSDPAPSFVLLVGDDQQIEAFSHGSHISDLDFCEYTGDHNPEMYYGRFSAQNPSLLQPQIDKTLEYEQYLMPDPAYLGEVTMIAGVDANYAPTHGNGQINYGVNLYFNSDHGIYSNTWLYPDSDQPGASAAIIQTVNDGIGFINYTAHGYHGGWADPSFTSGDVSNLTNAHMYPLAIGNCCLTVTFGDDYSTPCVGEVWLQSEEKGAIGYIGGSNSTYWDEDYWWGVGYGPIVGNGPRYEDTGIGVYDGVFHDHGEPVSQHYVVNDALIFCGNMAVQESGSNMTNYYWEIYHLMGDPSVMTYLGIPSANNVEHDDVIILGTETFTVTADPASYVGLSKDGVLHGAAYIDESGTVDLEIMPFAIPGSANLVVTGQNKEPYIITIQVIAPTGPYVIFDTCTVNDIGGNNDGYVDFGESILLGMQLANVGPDTAYDVSATLSTSDQYITITDDYETFGDIAGDFGTVNIEDAYAFDVPIDVPNGHVISFQLEISDSNDSLWIGNFTLIARAPDVDFVDVMIDDSAGNGNGIIDAGETVEMIVTLVNNGYSLAGAVTGVLSEDDEYVEITDSDGSFGDIAPFGETGDNAADVFVVVADDAYPQGHSVTFDLDITAEGGYTKNIQFILRAMESFEYNDGGWVGEGVWEWGVPTSGPNRAYDGANVWATALNGQYPDDADDDLLTTYYTVLNPNATFSFYHWYSMESGWDGGNIHVTTDGGSTWDLVTPESGYPAGSIVGLDGEPGFSGEIGDWEQVVVDLSAYVDQTIKLKFRFGSDGSITRDGWYIDGVVITGGINWGTLTPSMSVEPTSFSVSLGPGDIITHNLTLGNDGPGLLDFTARAITDLSLSIIPGESGGGTPIAREGIEKWIIGSLTYYRYVGSKYEASIESPDPLISTDFGGPDDFGYRWIDSDEPDGPTYNWIDITESGTPIIGLSDDTNVGPFDIGFEFPFYGNIFTTFRFCTNGWISFTSAATSYYNQPLPDPGGPYNLVAPFWDDLNFNDGGEAYYLSTGDSLIVSYINVPHYSYGGPGPYTFQVILLANGDIIYQYADINDPVTSNTIGIQNENGTIATQIVYDEYYAEADLAVWIKHPIFWLSVSPSGGFLFPDESLDLDVTFDASEVDEGIYVGEILITSNDPDNPTFSVPCTLMVTPTGIDDRGISIIPSAFALNQNYPNPFNPATTIGYGLPMESHVTINVYDILGRRVETLLDENQLAGYHQVIWDADDQPSGVYFLKLKAADFNHSIKMLLVR